MPASSGRAKRSPWQIQKAVVFALFIRELKGRFSYKLGYAWLLIEPLLHLALLTLVFAYIRGRSALDYDYPVFLVTGVVPFLMFKNIALRGMDAVENNRGLLVYRQIRPLDTLLARTLLETGLSLAVLVLILAGMAWLGFQVPLAHPLELMLLFVLQVAMGLGFGMVLAGVTYYLPELKSAVRMVFMPLYLLSGIIFPLSSLPRDVQAYLSWNPLLHALELFRGAMFPNYRAIDGTQPLFPLLVALLLLYLGLWWHHHMKRELVAS